MDSFNTALNCGTFLLPWNAVMLALGILVAVVVSEWIIKKRGMYKDLALDACIIGIPCGIVGGRLFAAISGKIAFSSIVDLSQTGMNLPGALLFAAVGVLIYTRIKKLDRGEVFDALLPGAFFGLAVGRWSDFFLCDGLVPKFFPLTTFTHAYFADHETVAYAVFFLDFLVCLALGAAALLMLKKKLQAGKAARVTMLLYIVAEFILEWLRDGEARQIVFGEIRFNQLVLIGMLFVLIGVTLFAKSARKAPEPEPEPETPEPEPEATEPGQPGQKPEAPEPEPEATEPAPKPEAPESSEPEPKAEEASETEA